MQFLLKSRNDLFCINLGFLHIVPYTLKFQLNKMSAIFGRGCETHGSCEKRKDLAQKYSLKNTQSISTLRQYPYFLAPFNSTCGMNQPCLKHDYLGFWKKNSTFHLSSY